MNIPIIIFHKGNHDYFQNCIKLNSINNFVYLIGDETNNNIFNNNTNVKYLNMSDLHFHEIDIFQNNFVNYSTNDYFRELFCFIRVFYMKKLMDLEKIDKICHLDSDCILLGKTNNIFSNIDLNSYLLTNRNSTKNKNICNSGTIHSSLLTIDFCNKFIELCLDIYVNKSKFFLIEPKINYFKDNNLPGGICDMALYYLLFSEKIINVINLNKYIEYDNELCVFDDNINDSESYYENTSFIMENGKKKIIHKNNKLYIQDSNNNLIRLLSIHFQGPAKNDLINMYTNIISIL
jgi:hypothetical protein